MNISEILRGKVKATVLDSYYSDKLGTVITCEITSGVIKIGSSLLIHQAGVPPEIVRVEGIEMGGNLYEEAYPTESVGLLFRVHDISYFVAGALIESANLG